MRYLYGDATASPLTSNYLELLRAVIDFSVALLSGTEAIQAHGQDGRNRRDAAATELQQLELVQSRLVSAAKDCAIHATAPVSARAVAAIREGALRDLERARTEVEATLSSELARIDAAIATQRAKNLDRLGRLLLHHDLPEAQQWVDVQLISQTEYGAQLVGHATSKVSWVIDLDIPTDHLFSQPLRLDRVAPQLTVRVPEEAGWVRKTMKLRTYKLAKEYVVALVRSGGNSTLKLREAIDDHDNGFDFTFSPKGTPLEGVRITKGVAAEPFEPEPDDVDALRALFTELENAAHSLESHRRALKKARLDGQPIQEHTAARVLVERLIGQVAPVVREIARHSLSPTELVLKRVLADDQRVEIFASKADLLAKLEPLSPELQRIFAPLGLGDAVVSKALPKSIADEVGGADEPRIGFSPSIPPNIPETKGSPPDSSRHDSPPPPALGFPEPRAASPEAAPEGDEDDEDDEDDEEDTVGAELPSLRQPSDEVETGRPSDEDDFSEEETAARPLPFFPESPSIESFFEDEDGEGAAVAPIAPPPEPPASQPRSQARPPPVSRPGAQAVPSSGPPPVPPRLRTQAPPSIQRPPPPLPRTKPPPVPPRASDNDSVEIALDEIDES